MKLDKTQIMRIVVGAVDHWEDEKGLHFAKYRPEQIAAWENVLPGLVPNVKASTGIRLDFHTDSSSVTFDVADGLKYEIKIDGMLTHQFTVSNEKTDSSFTVELGKKGEMKHVIFSLPSHGVPGVIRGVAVDDDAQIEPHKFDRKLLFLGDSITQGAHSKFDMLSYAYQVSDALNAESVIHGIGSIFFEPTAICDMGYTPDIVFVALGTNDYHYFDSLAEIEKRANAYLQIVKELFSNAKIYVITPIWKQDYDTLFASGSFQQCCDSIKVVAQKLDLEVIDGMKLVPHHSEFYADCLHPNDLGFTMYTKNLLRCIN